MRPSIVLTALLATASAIPHKRTTTITAADILTIDPATASCANAPIASECRTAAQAAPYIAVSFANFGITSFGEQAALLALMLYESGDFKYAQNHFPGVPGQGTRNMQSPAYNLKYAEYLATVCTNCGITSAQVQQASAEGPAALLALVNTEEWSFGSAAWYLVTQCGASVREGLAAGTQEGWEGYLQCVGTSGDEKRDQLWSAAMGLKQW
ncbi:hypothetical protein LTR91_022786 [Friedmanniomyces endolithicus]|uniref:Uncharacterized protein n=1 Tax=Friedmanniomyces endolithicus TaxID=329885 RepID=A0AAN6H4L2_9PEZI|nr:hypothetical protein LTR38_016056 [Friedmanniomyces endolithicus]KAK0887316.1 hypothetical protein LTR02_017349 [Friedmanniomyces endolithicus]KAK0955616.1 hypothetical protein LTR91_022786 [Friedmanniomyces endolithicus]